MGRISLFAILLTCYVPSLLAQSGGFPNLEFIENKGQWGSEVKFRAGIGAGYFFMHGDGFTVLQHDTADLNRIQDLLHKSRHSASTGGGGKTASAAIAKGGGKGMPAIPGDPEMVLHSHSYRVHFEGSNQGVEIVPDKPLPTYNNYFIGKDPSMWAAHCRIFQGVTYKNIYDGIDLHYYTDGGSLKYDLIVHPGADPGRITMRYEGQNKLMLKKNQVHIRTSVGTMREWVPRSYQVDEEGKQDVECNYTITGGNKVKFRIKDYAPGKTLVIDPMPVYVSFTGSRSDNWGYTSTYDNAGNIYLGGIVIDYPGFNGNGFYTTPGAFQAGYQGGDGSEGDAGVDPNTGAVIRYNYDIGIMKLNSTLSTALYSTYLGGSGDEQPHSMICDPMGNLIVTGRTSSGNFPTFPAGTTTYGPGGGFDLFITKFNASGTALIGSRRIGGTGSDGVNYSPKYVNSPAGGTQDCRINYGDDGRGELILDAANNIYLATCTQSSDFPVTPGAFQPASGGKQDGVFVKTSPDVSTILASSYIGGNGADAAFVLALNPINNNVYIAGATLSTDLRGVNAAVNTQALHSGNQGGVDGFISIVNNNGTALLGTTYFGTGGTDVIYGIEFDKNGFPYVTGTTTSVIPVLNSPFNQNGNQASGKQFITKLKPDLSGVIYSANFGPGGTPFPNISPTAFLVDRCENVYVSGWGGGINIAEHYNNSGTFGMSVTAGAVKPVTDGQDFYFFILQKNAASQLYGSFFGQQGGRLGDHVDGGTSRFDKQGVIYESVCANCYGPAGIFPTTPGAWATNNGTGVNGCNEAGVKIEFNFAGVAAALKAALSGRGDSLGCVPLTVNLQDTIRNAKTYSWDFGDGSAPILNTPNFAETHAYTTPGTYTVRLIAYDPNSCNVADTTYKTILAKNNPAFLNLKITKDMPCNQYIYKFDNLSTHSAGSPPFTASSFIWDFGDGTTVPAPPGITNHTYASPGSYNVVLKLVDTNYCNAPADTVHLLEVIQNVKAAFTTPPSGCAPYNAVMNNSSTGGQKFYWYFGDGSPVDSTHRTPPPHLYPNPGTYTIGLIVVDSNTCNIVDSMSRTITVSGKPAAAFSVVPIPPIVNTPDIFTNLSTGGVRYKWLFGDGDSAIRTTMDTVIHQYRRQQTFTACLVTFNRYGCTDTACQPVPVLINPLLDVPNAFTPGRFGQNGIVRVVGFGIVKMNWRIYNRWGQLVFQSNDQSIGWDGTYRGSVQPMDVYAYTLEADYYDGTHLTKKGDITLIR